MSSDETKPEENEAPTPKAEDAEGGAKAEVLATESPTDAPATDAPTEQASADAADVSSTSTEATTDVEAPVVEPTKNEAPTEPVASTKAPEPKAEPAAKGMTPGQRLAAQKAAKASKKQAEKLTRKEQAEAERAANEILTARPAGEPDEADLRVAETRTFVASHSKHLVYLGAAVVAVFLAWVGFEQYSAHKDAAAGRLLYQATEAARAEIREEPVENDRSRRLTFRSTASRDREALRRFRKVVSEASSSDAAVRARLGIASILVSQGKLTEAKRELSAAAELRGDDPGLGAQAIEGLGVIALEQRQWDEAKQRFEELRALDGNRYQHVANYLTARTLYAQGRANEAKPKLRALLDALEEADAPRLPYVQTQAELLLQQIDPSTARPSSRPSLNLGGGGLNLDALEGGQLPPELLEQLRRQLQQQGGGAQ